tara:strand:+ start:307 stop:486 length:180 start_codon:yes stop_codon:yes gene_type:complete
MKVENNEVWADILAKKVKGFSIEGFYIDKLATLSTKVENTKEDTDEEILTALSEILKVQ